MTTSAEPAKTDRQPGTPAVSSPKPKPANTPPYTPSGMSPKPKPNVAGKPSGIFTGGPRLAPFEAYMRADTSRSSRSEQIPEEGGMRTKPVAKKRLIAVFPGDTQKP